MVPKSPRQAISPVKIESYDLMPTIRRFGDQKMTLISKTFTSEI